MTVKMNSFLADKPEGDNSETQSWVLKAEELRCQLNSQP